jgi:hypothetical protein
MKTFYHEWADSLGITEPVNGTWIQAIATHLDATLENGTYISGLAHKLNLFSDGICLEEKIRDYRRGITPEAPAEPTPPVKSLIGGLFQTAVGTSNINYQPIYGLYNYSLSYTIILANELPTLDLMGSMQFQVSGYSSNHLKANQVIKIAHTTTNNLPSTVYSDNSTGGKINMSDITTVYSGDITYTNGWNTISFQDNFEWNGTDNIVIIIENNSGQWKSGYGWGESHTTTNTLSAFSYDDYNMPANMRWTMTRTTKRLNIKIGY